MAEFYRKKKKVCYMCTGKDIDYKDTEVLKKYINDKTVEYYDELRNIIKQINKKYQIK